MLGESPISIKIYYFGPADRPLLGALHQAARLRRSSVAVLLCNPMGEEATRAHRLYRVMASQIEHAGYAAMRFDYSGTGDSAGADAEATLDAWLSDIEFAVEELRAASGATQVFVVGLRVGGLLAALVERRGRVRFQHYVLWDPVVDGLGYLRELASAHRAFMTDEIGAARWKDRLRIDARGVADQALGMRLTAGLVDELCAADLTTALPRAGNVTVICTRDSAAMSRLRQSMSATPSARWLDMRSSSDWNSDAALNNATVPMDIVHTVVGRIQELSP
jgi:pimeloyl-ACP methyl ester carboxylesterase